MSIAIGVVTHPQRHVYAEQLQAATNADLICCDDGRGPNANHRRTWTELAALNPTYGVVLEDDAIVVKDFQHQLEPAITAAPTPIVSLYLGKQRPPQWMRRVQTATQRADTTDAHYILADHLLHGVAVAIHINHIQPMIDYTTRRNYLPWDEAVGAYARLAGIKISYLWPSLCDHNDSLPSLTKHRDRQPRPPGRVAWRIGQRTSWSSTTTVTM